MNLEHYTIDELVYMFFHSRSVLYLPSWQEGYLNHDFFYSLPFHIVTDYYDYRSKQVIHIVPVNKMERPSEWAQYLSYSDFKPTPIQHHYDLYIQNGLEVLTMERNWKNAATGSFFLDPFPYIYQLHFPYHKGERPTREYLQHIIHYLGASVDLNGRTVNECTTYKSKYAVKYG